MRTQQIRPHKIYKHLSRPRMGLRRQFCLQTRNLKIQHLTRRLRSQISTAHQFNHMDSGQGRRRHHPGMHHLFFRVNRLQRIVTRIKTFRLKTNTPKTLFSPIRRHLLVQQTPHSVTWRRHPHRAILHIRQRRRRHSDHLSSQPIITTPPTSSTNLCNPCNPKQFMFLAQRILCSHCRRANHN